MKWLAVCPGRCSLASRRQSYELGGPHPTHSCLMHSDTAFTWCSKCGSWANKCYRGLRVTCPEAPQSDAQQKLLKKLIAGGGPFQSQGPKADAARVEAQKRSTPGMRLVVQGLDSDSSEAGDEG